ncbi:MAG: glucose-1-phosphate thymidylyltransferase, partial [Muribaculaceae bacterium]|nr:glucose-1-phosphate thymidylyltransferase [Muribaculaceae bacterium]
YVTVDYLTEKFPCKAGEVNLFCMGHVLPTPELAEAAKALNPGQALRCGGRLVAVCGSMADFESRNELPAVTVDDAEPLVIEHLYDIFMKNGDALVNDYYALTAGRESQPLSETCTLVGSPVDDQGRTLVFIEEGATVEGAIINVKNGPVYIGRDAEVMEGCCLRGPIAMMEHSVANMGCKIYGATTLGPYCKVGGELNNVVMIGFSNKAHDGFLGNAVIGKWCNLGAGCVASNLKNDYTEIKLWNYPSRRFLKTGLQFCGLIMGDHSKAGINTMFNTATVLGVGVNIHGSGFPRNFVPSFSEGSTAGYTDVQLSKFFAIARRVYARRHRELTDADMRLFEAIYNIAENYK